MNVSFRRASQMQNHTKQDSVVCTLYEARAQGMQTYSIKQQEDLRMVFFQVSASVCICPDFECDSRRTCLNPLRRSSQGMYSLLSTLRLWKLLFWSHNQVCTTTYPMASCRCLLLVKSHCTIRYWHWFANLSRKGYSRGSTCARTEHTAAVSICKEASKQTRSSDGISLWGHFTSTFSTFYIFCKVFLRTQHFQCS